MILYHSTKAQRMEIKKFIEAHVSKKVARDCWGDVSQCQKRWTTQLARVITPTRSLEYSILVYGLRLSWRDNLSDVIRLDTREKLT
jgi:hypothetical protein